MPAVDVGQTQKEHGSQRMNTSDTYYYVNTHYMTTSMNTAYASQSESAAERGVLAGFFFFFFAPVQGRKLVMGVRVGVSVHPRGQRSRLRLREKKHCLYGFMWHRAGFL